MREQDRAGACGQAMAESGRSPVADCEVGTKMNVTWKDRIESDPNVLRGRPRIKGARIPVRLILGYFATGYDTERIITEFPDLNRDQIAAGLDYARELAEFEVVA